MKPLYIGIDPGTDTGLAVWDPDAQRLTTCKTLGLYAAIKEVLKQRDAARLSGRGVVLVFEDARRRTWIPREKSLAEMKGRAMGAGSVKRDSSVWEEFCKVEEIPFFHPGPRPGLTKWKEPYFKALTKWQGRTSHHARDAAALVFGM